MKRHRKVLTEQEAEATCRQLTNDGIMYECVDGLGIFKGKKIVTWFEATPANFMEGSEV